MFLYPSSALFSFSDILLSNLNILAPMLDYMYEIDTSLAPSSPLSNLICIAPLGDLSLVMEAGYMEPITHWSDQIWPLVALSGSSSGVLIFRSSEHRRPDATFNAGR